MRQKYNALQKGKLIHFPPKDNVYIYFRILDDEKLLIVVNGNDEQKEIDLSKYLHLLKDKSTLKNVLSGKDFPISEKLVINKMTADVFEVK